MSDILNASQGEAVGAAARAYAEAGFKLVPIPNGKKGPTHKNWHTIENCISDPDTAAEIDGNVGLAHAYSRTCVIDIDNIALATAWLKRHGIDLAELMDAVDAVMISSGRDNRAKLLYRLPGDVSPLTTRQPPDSGLELRCGSGGGLTVQDVLPPSIHPDTGQPYTWIFGEVGHWSCPPALPDTLLAHWRSLCAIEHSTSPGKPAGKNSAVNWLPYLKRIDPDVSYPEWISVGMALHHESGGDARGLTLWDEWSAEGSKYKSPGDLLTHWRSFGKRSEKPITGKTIKMLARATQASDFSEVTDPTTDPLEGLLEKAAADPGAAFVPVVLEALAELKFRNRPAFETLRNRLSKSGCRVMELDALMDEFSDHEVGRAPSHADILVELAGAADLFHSPDDNFGLADISIKGHRETWPVRSRGFKLWLMDLFYRQTGSAPSADALQSALNVIEAKALFDGPARQVFLRVGGLDGKLYLDLADEAWRVVEIDASGWRVVDRPPVRFRRVSGMKAVPMPVSGGSVETLRTFLNVKTDADFVLVVAWALGVLRDKGPYPVLIVSGEQGSAKSTFTAILKALLDPSAAPMRSLTPKEHDLYINANNSHLLAFDNLSGLTKANSDLLCKLATGGGFATRQLYTDQDLTIFEAQRPMILNGIEDVVTRPDLADRAIFLTLEPIPEDRRRPESALWAEFEAERPKLLGVLMDAVAKGLAELPHTKLDQLPRMADFAVWAVACENAFWPAGTFWAAYSGNREEAVTAVIDADPVATAVRTLMTARTEWTGTASSLLRELQDFPGDDVTNSKAWPKTNQSLAGRMRRVATSLRKIGIEVSFQREGRSRNRIIRITRSDADLQL